LLPRDSGARLPLLKSTLDAESFQTLTTIASRSAPLRARYKDLAARLDAADYELASIPVTDTSDANAIAFYKAGLASISIRRDVIAAMLDALQELRFGNTVMLHGLETALASPRAANDPKFPKSQFQFARDGMRQWMRDNPEIIRSASDIKAEVDRKWAALFDGVPFNNRDATKQRLFLWSVETRNDLVLMKKFLDGIDKTSPMVGNLLNFTTAVQD